VAERSGKMLLPQPGRVLDAVYNLPREQVLLIRFVSEVTTSPPVPFYIKVPADGRTVDNFLGRT